MKRLSFSKMHGLGNDFMVLDGRAADFPRLDAARIGRWADRHRGVGFDQLLLLEPGDAEHDFTYRIFNADGSEVEHCGNGARCFAHYVHLHGLHDFRRPLRVKIQRGSLSIEREESSGEALYRVAMGWPQLGQGFQAGGLDFQSLDLGNPHAVAQVADVERAPLLEVAPALQRNQALFPQSVNVGLMQILQRNQIRLRVYERGVGETQACGSGACAAAVVGMAAGLLNEKVEVNFSSGGRLWIEWRPGEPVQMLGGASWVYRGEIELD